MRILEEFKIKKITKFSQLILLDEHGYVTDSCDTIFPTHQIRSKPIFEWFPIIESIFSELLLLNLNESELRFAKVEKPSNFLSGFYDFNFSKVIFKNKEQILWSIYDFTNLYKDFIAYQQRINEIEIRKQLAESKGQTAQNNYEKISKPVFNKQYQHTVIKTLQSEQNILDSLQFSLNPKSVKTDLDYLSQLKVSLGLLQNIIQEFEEFISLFPAEYNYTTKQSFPVRQFCQQILSSVKKELLLYKKNFNYTISDSLVSNFVGVPSSFAQMLYYLSTHSLKFAQVTDIELNIDFKTIQKENTQLEIQLIEKLTDFPFPSFQNNSQNNYDTELSYRLSILKKLIDSLGGNIQASNQKENNTIIINCSLSLMQITEMV